MISLSTLSLWKESAKDGWAPCLNVRGCATAREAVPALIEAHEHLRASLMEMRDAAAAMMRVINNAVDSKADIIDDLEDEFKAAGVENGFGVRADRVLAAGEQE